MDNQLKNQIREVLDDGLGYMKVVSKNYTILITAISNEDQDGIKKNYENLKEGLGWLLDALNNFEVLLELDYETILVGKQKASKIIENYKSFILEWEFSFNRGDYRKLSELTETELLKYIKKVTSIFNKVKTIMNEKEN